MKTLHLDQARCHGRDTKSGGAICQYRNTCQRHLQLELDKQIGISGDKRLTVMNLPFVPGQDCHYRLRTAP